MEKVDPLSWSLAIGAVWGVMCSAMAIVALTGYGSAFMELFGSIYIGYQAGIIGAVLGLVYGFIDMFVMTYVIILLHNRLVDYLR
jgi:hypothetical protein